MKKGEKLIIISLICIASFFFFSLSLSMISSYDVEIHDVNSTLAQIRIVNATELYGYELNFLTTDANPTVTFNDALKQNGQETTTGNEISPASGSYYILSVYESLLDAAATGVNLTNNSVFNISHTGTITLREQLNTYSNQNVLTESEVQICEDPPTACTDYGSCSQEGIKSRSCTSPTCFYWEGVRIENTSCVYVANNPASSGGGGASANAQALNIEFGNPDIQESGKVVIPVTLKNGGTIAFSNVEVTGFLKKNGVVLTDIPVELNKESIASLPAGKSESLIITANIKENDVNFYEILINVKSKNPVYEVSNKVLFTFVGLEGGKVLKVVAFTSGLIEEHPECLELKDMITDAQTEFNKGNTQAALQKANQAVEACKSYLESPLKPILSQKQYDKIPLYLGIGIAGAILLGIVFNVYRSYVFKRKFR